MENVKSGSRRSGSISRASVQKSQKNIFYGTATRFVRATRNGARYRTLCSVPDSTLRAVKCSFSSVASGSVSTTQKSPPIRIFDPTRNVRLTRSATSHSFSARPRVVHHQLVAEPARVLVVPEDVPTSSCGGFPWGAWGRLPHRKAPPAAESRGSARKRSRSNAPPKKVPVVQHEHAIQLRLAHPVLLALLPRPRLLDPYALCSRPRRISSQVRLVVA
jgi:hypothetical protein